MLKTGAPLALFCTQNPRCEVILRLSTITSNSCDEQWIMFGTVLHNIMHGSMPGFCWDLMQSNLALRFPYPDSSPISSNIRLFSEVLPSDMVDHTFLDSSYANQFRTRLYVQVQKWCKYSF